MTSPINRMIDAACEAEKPTKEQRANTAADEIIWYIDHYHPSMWDAVPKSVRTRIKNFARKQVLRALQ